MHWGTGAYALAKFVHVLVAATWVGASAYGVLILRPVLQQATPGMRREFIGRAMPVAFRWGNALGGLTLLSGALVLYAQRDGFGGLTVGPGRFIAYALVANVAVLYLLNVAARPSFRKIQQLAAETKPGEPPHPGIALLQRRLGITQVLGLAILVSAVAAMVAADVGL